MDIKKLFLILIALILFSCDPGNAPNQYSLNVLIEPDNAGSVTPNTGAYTDGEVIEIEAKPVENGSTFLRWEGDYSSTSNPVMLNMNKDYNLIAVFEFVDHPLNIEIEGFGSVEESLMKTNDYEYNSEVRLTAIPDEGFEFIRWEGDISGTETNETIVIDSEKSVRAVFTDFVNDREGHQYKVVSIDGKKWFAENLRTKSYSNGDSIEHLEEPYEWAEADGTGAWAYPFSDASNYEIYGLLYNGYAVNDSRGLCPSGWTVPSENDFQALEAFIGLDYTYKSENDEYGGSINLGGKLKATGTEYWLEPNEGATNDYGFSAIPAGIRSSGGVFSRFQRLGVFLATKFDDASGWNRGMAYDNSSVTRYLNDLGFGASVRCIYDESDD